MQENILTSIAQDRLLEIFNQLRQKYQPKPLTQEEKNAISDLNQSEIHLEDSVQEWLHTNKILPFQEKHKADYYQIIDTYTQKKPHLLQNKTNPNWPIIFALKDDITQTLLGMLSKLELSLNGINLNDLTDDTESAKVNRETLKKQLVHLLRSNQKSSSASKNQIAKAYRYLIALQSLNTIDSTGGRHNSIIKKIDKKDKGADSAHFFSEWLSALYILRLHATKNDVYSSLSGKLTDEQIREEFLETIVQALHDCYRAYNVPEHGKEEHYGIISKPSCKPGSVGRLGKAVFKFSKELSVTHPCTPSFSPEIEKHVEDVMIHSLKEQLIQNPDEAKTLLLTIEKIMAGDEVEFPLQNFFNWADSASEKYSEKHAQAIIQKITEDLLNTWTADLSDQKREEAFNDHLEATKQLVSIIFTNSAHKFNARVIGDSPNTQVSGAITDRMKFVAFQSIFDHSKEKKQEETQQLLKNNPQYFLKKDLPFFKDLVQVTELLPFYFQQNGFLGTLELLRTISRTIPKEDELYLWSNFIQLSLANHENFSLLEQSEKLAILKQLLTVQDPHEKKFQSHLINQLSIPQFFELFNQLISNQQDWQELASSSLMDALIQKALDHPSDDHPLITMRNELQKDGDARLRPNALIQFQKEKVIPSIINKLKSEAKQGKNKLLNFLLDPTKLPLCDPACNNSFIITEFLNELEPENLPLQTQSKEFTQEQRKQMDLNKDVLAPPLTPKNFMGIFGDSIFQYDVTQSSSTLNNLQEFKSLTIFRSLFLQSKIALDPDRLLNFLKKIETNQSNPQLIYFFIPLLKHPNSECKRESYQTLLLLCSQLCLKPIEDHDELSIQTHELLTLIENSLKADAEFSNLMTSLVFTQQEQILLKKQFSEMIAQQLMESDEKEKIDAILRFLLLDKTAFPNLNKIFKYTDALFQEVLNNLSLEDFKRVLANKLNIIVRALTSSQLDFSQLQLNKQTALLIYLSDQARSINLIDWIPILTLMSSADLVSLVTHPNLLDQNGKTARKRLLELCWRLPETQYAAFLKQLSTEASFISEEWQNYLDQQCLAPWQNGCDRSSILQEAKCTLYIQDIKNIAEEKGKIFKNKWAQGDYSAVLEDLKQLNRLLTKPSEIFKNYNCSRDELKGYLKEWFQLIRQSYSEALQKNPPEQAHLIKSALQKAYNDAYLQKDVFFCSLYLSIFKLTPSEFKILPAQLPPPLGEPNDTQRTITHQYSHIRNIVDSYKEICKENNPLKNDDVCDGIFLKGMFTQLNKDPAYAPFGNDTASLSAMGCLIQMETYAPIPNAPTSFEDINRQYKSNREKNKAFLVLFEQEIYRVLHVSRQFYENHLTTDTVSPAQVIAAQVTRELEIDLKNFFNQLNGKFHQQNPGLDNKLNPKLDPKLANVFNDIQTAEQAFEKILYDTEKRLNELFHKPGYREYGDTKAFSSKKDWSLSTVVGSTLLLIFTGGLAIFYLLDKIQKKEPIFGHSYYEDVNKTLQTLRKCKYKFFPRLPPMTAEGKRFQRTHNEEQTQPFSTILKL